MFKMMSRPKVFEALNTLGVDLSVQCVAAKNKAEGLEKGAKVLESEAKTINKDAMDEYSREEAKLRAQRETKMQTAKGKTSTAAKDLGWAQALRSAAQLFSKG